jgi:hypothetical protein
MGYHFGQPGTVFRCCEPSDLTPRAGGRSSTSRQAWRPHAPGLGMESTSFPLDAAWAAANHDHSITSERMCRSCSDSVLTLAFLPADLQASHFGLCGRTIRPARSRTGTQGPRESAHAANDRGLLANSHRGAGAPFLAPLPSHCSTREHRAARLRRWCPLFRAEPRTPAEARNPHHHSVQATPIPGAA